MCQRKSNVDSKIIRNFVVSICLVHLTLVFGCTTAKTAKETSESTCASEERGVYKYRDQEGNIYFSDCPLNVQKLTLEWVRLSKRFDESDDAAPTDEPDDSSPYGQTADDVAADLAIVLAELDDRKRKLVLLETLIMEKDQQRRRIYPGMPTTDAVRILGAPKRRAVIDKLGEAPMTIHEYQSLEIYTRGGRVIAVKRY